MHVKLIAALFSLFGAIAPAWGGNVIFITIDGVRPEDAKKVFKTHTPHAYAVQVSNRSALSLPGYRALFSGNFEIDCTGNYDCPNIARETVIDHLVDQGLPLQKIAAISSWKETGLAIESKPRVFRSIAGVMSGAVETLNPHVRASIESKNAKALQDLPLWNGAVKDVHTWSIAMDYLEAHHPRFLYVGLLDTDEWAHLSKRKKYLSELTLLRDRIIELQTKLSTMGDYGKDTSIFLTTDHGRGIWPFRAAHGKSFPHSFKAWARIFPSETANTQGLLSSIELSEQVHIRPTLEKLVGQIKN